MAVNTQQLMKEHDALRIEHMKLTTKLEASEAENVELVEALEDMLSGWRYIRDTHGSLYGVGWERAENKAVKALAIHKEAR